ncbi:hypothetical protein V2H77_12580 [Photorhabdus sp. P32]|uniref:hypothetical protein n=1 Tax=Photorhabdus sp. P32 TaxID=3117549 RepID=UPI00311AEAE5
MTNRVDIDRDKLIYTEDLGWIDLGHARGDDSRMLWEQLITEKGDSPFMKGYFLVSYTQSMSKYFFKSSINAQWMVKRIIYRN